MDIQISKYNMVNELERSLVKSCREKNIQDVKKFISLGAKDFNRAIHAFYYDMDQEIVDLLIDRGVDDENFIFSMACNNSNLIMARKYVQKIEYLEDGLALACKRKDKDIIELIITNLKDISEEIFRTICKYGDMNYINSLIDKGCNHWNVGLNGACISGNLEIAKFMIIKGAEITDVALQYACIGNNTDLIKYITINKHLDYNCGLFTAFICGREESFNLMIEMGATNNDTLLHLLKDVLKYNKNIVSYVLSNCKAHIDDFVTCNSIIRLLNNGLDTKFVKDISKFSKNKLKRRNKIKIVLLDDIKIGMLDDIIDIITEYITY